MPSTRRALLTSVGATAAVALAGCSGSDSSSTPDCSSHNFNHSDPEVIHAVEVNTFADSDDAHLVVKFLNKVDMSRLDLISIYSSDDNLAFSIPVVAGNGPEGTHRRYEQTLGTPPQHGRYRVVVTNFDDEQVDEVTADLHCYGQSTDT